MATMLNHADGTGISAERYKRLLECEECLLGLVDPVEECVKQVSDSIFPFVYPNPPDRFNIWTQMKYVVANLKEMRTFADQENVHDAEYENWSLPGRIRLLARTRNHAPTTDATGLTITKEQKDSLEEADRCLTGLLKPIEEAFLLAQGGTKYEPNAPEGEFDIWETMKYIAAQLRSISKESEKNEFTNNALKSASLSDRVSLLIAENKSRDMYYQDYKNCLNLLQTEITTAHRLVDGSGSLSGDLEETTDPDILGEMRYVVNSIELVDEALNKYKVATYKGARWTDLNLDYRVHAVAHSRERNGQDGVNDASAHANGSTVSENAKPEGDDLVEHFKGIFEKLYDEIGNLKDEVFKERVVELLGKVLPSGESTTTRPVDPRHGEIDPDV